MKSAQNKERTLEILKHRKRDEIDLSSYNLGKLPPQARELEEAVLGACMLEADAVPLIIDILKPESFYVHQHKLVFTAILNLFNKSKPVDILTVTEELKQMRRLEDVGGAFFVTDLTSRIASAANVEHHARVVAQKFIQRELIRISSDLIKVSYEDSTDVFETLDSAEQSIFGIIDHNLRRNFTTSTALVAETIKEIEAARRSVNKLTGIPSGFTALDRVTRGWNAPDLVIVAARPGMGKTSFCLALARNAAVEYGKAVAFFSLEMSAKQIMARLLSSETEIEASRLKGDGDIAPAEWEGFMNVSETIANAPIFVDDTAALNLFEMRAKCRRLKMQHDIKLIIVDYLQLMAPVSPKGNREQEVSEISRGLKSLAKELDLPVIALSQLSRATETRASNKRPQLSDLRDSGGIEQDADIVIFLYRAEYYGLDVLEDNSSSRGIAEVIIAKHRNGALKSVFLKFIDKYTKFIDAEAQPAKRESVLDLEPNVTPF